MLCERFLLALQAKSTTNFFRDVRVSHIYFPDNRASYEEPGAFMTRIIFTYYSKPCIILHEIYSISNVAGYFCDQLYNVPIGIEGK